MRLEEQGGRNKADPSEREGRARELGLSKNIRNITFAATPAVASDHSSPADP